MRRAHEVAGRGGFTLIEVVVALAVLGVGLTILIESHYSTIRTFTRAQEESEAKLAVVQASSFAEREILAGKASGKGVLGARFPEFSFEFKSEARDKKENPGLFAVELKITGPGLDRTLEYFVYDGTQVDVGKPAR